jgi:hypothetical protein
LSISVRLRNLIKEEAKARHGLERHIRRRRKEIQFLRRKNTTRLAGFEVLVALIMYRLLGCDAI